MFKWTFFINGNLCKLIPFVLILSTVVIKLIAKNKDKKRFKKERAQIKSQGILNQLSQLDVQISKLNFNKENIEEKIINKKNELNQFILNNKEYTILDLLNLQKKYTNNNNIFNLKKTRKLNYNINGVVLDNLIPKQ